MSEKPFQAVGILLCAGRGRRFDPSGRHDKLLQSLDSGELVAQASARRLRQACHRVVAVLRPGSPALKQLLIDADCEVIECPDADHGMSATLRAGLLHTSHASAWLVALADMPHVQPQTCVTLLEALAAGAAMVAPFYDGRRGNPVGFSAVCLPELLALQGDQGARALLSQSRLQKLPVDDAGILRDIDTPADLAQP